MVMMSILLLITFNKINNKEWSCTLIIILTIFIRIMKFKACSQFKNNFFFFLSLLKKQFENQMNHTLLRIVKIWTKWSKSCKYDAWF